MTSKVESKTEISIFIVSVEFITRRWDELSVFLAQAIVQDENVQPDKERMNGLLRGFISEELDMWVAMQGTKLLGFFVTSTYGGPGGGLILYISFIRGLTNVPPMAFKEGFRRVEEHATRKGCNTIIGHTANVELASLAKQFGFEQDIRLMRRM